MGAAKFPEEIVERYIEDTYAGEQRALETISPVVPKLVLNYCPICFEGFIEIAALDFHIASKHGKQHVFLRLNNQVMRDICWLNGPIRECTLVVLKEPDVRVGLTVHGCTQWLTVTEDTDLLRYMPKGSIDRHIEIIVRTGGVCSEFRIYQGKQPAFRSNRIDDQYSFLVKKWLAAESVDLAAFRDRCSVQNDLEKRYLDGILEYSHGLLLENERKRHLARPRIESAMNLLMPFRTSIAEAMRHALAFRMNCFLGQWNCPATSRFRIAEQFFCKRYTEFRATDFSPTAIQDLIVIDPVSRRILDALDAYHDQDEKAALQLLPLIERRDRNDEDKLDLIEARTRVRIGDHGGARSTYGRLRGHPVFGQEAEICLMARGQV